MTVPNLGSIDLNKKPQIPKIFLAKPDGTIIARVKDAYTILQKNKLGSLNELSFDLPYQTIINSELQRTRYIDMVKERYLLKIQLGSHVEWYIINKITDKSSDSADYKSVSAFSLGYELKDKILRGYEKVSITATQALNDAMLSTIWNVGYVDGDFDTKYRSFTVSSKSVLDFIFEIAETYNAIIEWDTVNRTVGLRKPELVGLNKGLSFSYGHYLKSIDKDISTDEMVTRLKAYGKDGLTFNSVNSTGSNYIEDFSFFMYPFNRDVNKNVIASSYYMTDGLCNAILDYKDLVTQQEGTFASFLAQRKTKETEMTTLKNQMFDLNVQLKQIQDIIDVQQAQGNMTLDDFTYSGSPVTKITNIKNTLKFAVFAKVSSTINITVKLDGVTQTLVDGTWKMIGKKQNATLATMNFTGSGTGIRCQYVIANILDAEYTASGNESSLIEKYVLDNKQIQVNAKQAEINAKQAEINTIDLNISNLRNLLAVDANFTPAQIKEMNMYIIEKEWTDNNYIDEQTLLTDAKKKFNDIRSPQTIIKIDIVNFLEIVKEQRNWDKISLGDTVTIFYDRFNINVTSKIIEIEYNYENTEINLTIANIKDINTDRDKLVKLLYGSASTSTTVDMKKFKWDKVEQNESDIRLILDNVWNSAERAITAGVNESVLIDRRGITITDVTDTTRFLRATHGVLGITNDGGNTFKHAITADGIIAERLYGQIIVGQNLTIGDTTGSFNIVGNLLTVKDTTNAIRVELGEYVTGKYGLRLTSKNSNKTILDEGGILQTWQVQEADNMDATHPVALKIYLPPDTASIRKAILNFSLEKFRTYSTGSSAGGGGTSTSSSYPGTTATSAAGGGTTATSSSGGGTTASSSSGGGTTQTSGGGLWFSQAGYTSGFDATSTDGIHNHGITDNSKLALTSDGSTVSGFTTFVQSGNHSHLITINHSHDVTIPNHTHNVTIADHTHNITIPNHTHTVTIPAHSHDVTIPDHTHTLIYGIYESTTPTSVKVKINGIDRTIDLGGGSGWSTDMTNLDITSYLNIGQWNTIELSSSRLGRVNGVIFIQAFMNV